MNQQIRSVSAGVICFCIAIVVQCIADFIRDLGVGPIVLRRTHHTIACRIALSGSAGTISEATAFVDSPTDDCGAIHQGDGEVIVHVRITVVVESIAFGLSSGLVLSIVIRVFGSRARNPSPSDTERGWLCRSATDSVLIFTALKVMDQ